MQGEGEMTINTSENNEHELTNLSGEEGDSAVKMGSSNRNHVTIEIEETLGKAKPLFTTKCCIYRVPNEIRKLNEDAYTPRVVSIGPFHYYNPRLQKMEGQKQTYCKRFIERAETSLDNLVRLVQQLEPRVRDSYSENIKVDKLVNLVLVDCGFIIEFFWEWYYQQWPQDDIIQLKEWLFENIILDLLLLENQLPFFVLEELYNLAFPSHLKLNGRVPSFMKLSLRFFSHFNKQRLQPTGGINHFTDLLRTFHLQSSDTQPERDGDPLTHLLSASELNEAGIKFMVNEESECLLDLQFLGNKLEIPQLVLEDHKTELVFRNMVEVCHYPHEAYITDYVAVFDFLINTGKDVDILVQSGIIQNMLADSNEAAELFNGLWKNIITLEFNSDYRGICEDLNKYCKHPWNNLKATLRHDYCKTPWQMVASIAAVILLVLTIIQTVCSVLQVLQS